MISLRSKPLTTRLAQLDKRRWAVILTPVMMGWLLIFASATLRRHRTTATTNPADRDRFTRTLIGCTKRRIAAMMGQPRTFSTSPMDVWYYPVSSRKRLAVAISFDKDRVRRIEFLDSPT